MDNQPFPPVSLVREPDWASDLLLTIRFSASIPDMLVEIPYPSITTAAGLKQLIRARLPPDLSTHRLRLIYAGRGLEDAVPLWISLKLTSVLSSVANGDPKGKGKTPVHDPPLPRLYVHCSIGDVALSRSDLAAEAAIASTLQELDPTSEESVRKRQQQQRSQQQQQQQEMLEVATPTTTPAPRGFDRLLSAGFTPGEVATLRSQFLALQSISHTPETMPSGDELRDLEDRWMDEGPRTMAGGGGTIGGPFAADDDTGFGTGSQAVLDDMLWGAVMGFFWPVGCAMWLRREEGVWSWRKGLAVFVGIVVNAAFGAMRVMN